MFVDCVLSLGVTLATWWFFAVPITTIDPKGSLCAMAATVATWCVAIPSAMIATNFTSVSLLHDSKFIVVKLVSVSVTLIVIQLFIIWNYITRDSNHVSMTNTLGFLFFCNILEACCTEFINVFDNRSTEDRAIDVSNSLCGVVLLVLLVVERYNNMLMSVRILVPDVTDGCCQSGRIHLVSNLRSWFISAYTTWNLLFRIQLGATRSVLMFSAVSLFMPLWVHFTGRGDWLQMRGVGLLAGIIFNLGITPAFRLLPLYNMDGFDEDRDKSSLVTKLQEALWFRILLLLLTVVCLVGACIDSLRFKYDLSRPLQYMRDFRRDVKRKCYLVFP